MRGQLFNELVRDDLGIDVASTKIRKLRTSFKAYQGRMSEFNSTVYFDTELYKKFLEHIKSNTRS